MKKGFSRSIIVYLFLQTLFVFDIHAGWINFSYTLYDVAKSRDVVIELKKESPDINTINVLFEEANGKKGADPDTYNNIDYLPRALKAEPYQSDDDKQGDTFLHIVAKNKNLDQGAKIELIQVLYSNKVRMAFDPKYRIKPVVVKLWYDSIEFAANAYASEDLLNAAKQEIKEKTYQVANDLFLTTNTIQDFEDSVKKNKAQLKVRDKQGKNLIHEFVGRILRSAEITKKNRGQYEKIISYFILQGVSVNDRYGRRGLTPLNIAVEKEDKEFFSFLLEKGFPSTSASNYSLFHSAIARKVTPEFIKFMITELKKKDINLLKEHLNHIASVFTKSSIYQFTPLQTAIFNIGSKAELIEALLSAKDLIELNKLNLKNNSALHMAVQRGYFDVVKLLVESGADPDVPDKFGLTPLHLAANNHSNWKGRYSTVFHSQTAIQDVNEIIDYLIKNGANVNAQTKDFGEKYGWEYFCDEQTPLHFALLREEYDIARILVEKGADLSLANIRGEKPSVILSKLSKKFSNQDINNDLDAADIKLVLAFREKEEKQRELKEQKDKSKKDTEVGGLKTAIKSLEAILSNLSGKLQTLMINK